MGRTMQALRICQKKIEQHGVKRMRLVATEACRRARNGREFLLDRMFEMTGGRSLDANIALVLNNARLAVGMQGVAVAEAQAAVDAIVQAAKDKEEAAKA